MPIPYWFIHPLGKSHPIQYTPAFSLHPANHLLHIHMQNILTQLRRVSMYLPIFYLPIISFATIFTPLPSLNLRCRLYRGLKYTIHSFNSLTLPLSHSLTLAPGMSRPAYLHLPQSASFNLLSTIQKYSRTCMYVWGHGFFVPSPSTPHYRTPPAPAERLIWPAACRT